MFVCIFQAEEERWNGKDNTWTESFLQFQVNELLNCFHEVCLIPITSKHYAWNKNETLYVIFSFHAIVMFMSGFKFQGRFLLKGLVCPGFGKKCDSSVLYNYLVNIIIISVI